MAKRRLFLRICESAGTYSFERTTDLTDVSVDSSFNKNVLINYLVKELSNGFENLSGTDLETYVSQLERLEFNFATVSGSLNMDGFNTTTLSITANNVVYRGTPINVAGATSIKSAQIEITLNGTFDLTGSEADVANGIYTNQSGNISLASSIL